MDEPSLRDEQSLRALSPASSELVERGDLDELTRHVNRLVASADWDELAELRVHCRLAVERGKQLWAVAANIEYRLALEAPGRSAAMMLETAPGRFALGPLPEVAASTHTWEELSPHLHPTPQAAMAAHERVMRGDDLTDDLVAIELPEVLDLPWSLQPWEPSYALAEYEPDRMGAPSPKLPALTPLRGAAAGERESLSGGLTPPSRRSRRGGQLPCGPGRHLDGGVERASRGHWRPRGCLGGYRGARSATARDRPTRAGYGARCDGVGSGERRRIRSAARRGTRSFCGVAGPGRTWRPGCEVAARSGRARRGPPSGPLVRMGGRRTFNGLGVAPCRRGHRRPEQGPGLGRERYGRCVMLDCRAGDVAHIEPLGSLTQ